MKWMEHVDSDVPLASTTRCRSWLPTLEVRVRQLISGWGRGLEGHRKEGKVPVFGEYVPDQQGCYEIPSSEGGTLACAPSSYSGLPNRVVLGVAKQKGKHRVVTMQSAEVKRVLTPVHNALYDYISSFGWCVRGDVQKEDFEAVIGDRREGEVFISGDYQAATDNIYLPAVNCIVRVISECPELTEVEREMLLRSFDEVRYKPTRCHPGQGNLIKRGSMMGNLVSFPLLCLLNKACFDIACDIRDGGGEKRVGRFNGDDCLFNGDDEFFGTWTRIVETFGFVVNKEKTERSTRWLDLNSRTYDRVLHRFIGKPVLSFLRTNRHAPGSILKSIVDGIQTFRWSVQLMIVNDMCRHEIMIRGPLSDVGCLTPRWRQELLKRKWFRTACLVGPAPVLSTGVRRSMETVVGPVPDSRTYRFVLEKSAVLQRECVDLWLGKKVKPLKEKIDRVYYKSQKSSKPAGLQKIYQYDGTRWAFVWPKELLVFFQEYFPERLRSCDSSMWMTDNPLLTTRPHFLVSDRCHRYKNKSFAPKLPPWGFGVDRGPPGGGRVVFIH